ncbi:DNA topoisomerase 4 subunit A [uncultured Alphaproteobacteria bacterium]|uniref:DNA topoisomerase 4 subunit A n=1 Tax=uncultured Alphaproteobacteria bacterium TaxID=91750 RepID=A0A212J6V0_9PROT|nr:DNA topoisomerase 4 subunit A [uncultured Alphaproteobacteria bacterium]
MTKTVEDVRDVQLGEALGDRYLAYALSTIVSRSLPDVRDGLKPVHRRLLYAMRQLKLDPASGFKKCARVVGDVIGKYHPHGDTAVYEALVRLAQDFAVRYPLIEGQGNFGNIDGDNAAAMRYTESRLTAVAQALMDGLDEDSVDFRKTYDGEDEEPVVLPAAFPNLLANGASGIAVGMATNIPPHNAAELCEALHHLIKVPEAPVAELLQFVPGPDFPTGGILVEDPLAIREAYETGRGGFRLRARWQRENLSHGLYQIVVTEIPYQVQKSKLVERIAELMAQKKLPLLADIRDESTEDVRLVLEPRNRSVDADLLMEQLFRLSELEIRFSLNMNVIDAAGVPAVLDLKQVLKQFLDHRHEVLERRSRHRLAKIRHRLEILDGFLICYLNLDEVIRIIREEDEPKASLMAAFKLTEVQAEAILNMRLRSLRRLEEMQIKTEHKGLSEEAAGLEALLADPALRWKKLDDEIAAIGKTFAKDTELGRRRTDFGAAGERVEVPVEAFIEKEPITVVLSQKGWIRAVKGHVEINGETKFKDGDDLALTLQAQTTDRILFFATNGRFYTLVGDKIPRGRGFGEPLRLHLDLPNDAEIVAMRTYRAGGKLLIASGAGYGFVVAEDGVVAQTRTGKQILNLNDGEAAALCRTADAGDAVASLGQNRRLLIFTLAEIPEMTRGRGVILQKFKNDGLFRDGGLADLRVFAAEHGLQWKTEAGVRTVPDMAPWQGKRAQVGRPVPPGFPRNLRFGFED